MNPTMKKLMMSAILLSLPILGNAQDKTADDYVEYRQGVFNAIGWHFKKMGPMIQGRIPYDAVEFKRHAEAVAVLSHMPAEGFVKEAKDSTLPTRVKPDVWFQTERFNTYMDDMIKAAAELAEQAGVEDKDELRPAYGNVAKQCKACHDRYRERG
ncbi:Cytochrome c556 [Neptunomonas antarctica]|uniref:Cytochrome c556 n=2 Tax=Neptunomonas antarctica TaxID=619304 RepID=A0A1N7K4E3_9GAMM|nr:Cytochrome c556 [Neptunomonas antarctica]